MPQENGNMRAVILVGGFGTRLRPLTFTEPKPLVPFCNKPMIVHQVEALKEAGVSEVILAVAYRPDAMKAQMDEWAKKLGVTFVFSVEEEPLGTAGPLGLARDILLQDENPFFVLNSDVTCPFPLKDLLEFHKRNGREGTIMVTKVVEWGKYGVVVFDEKDNRIERFVEKPQEFVGDKINAGIYVFNKSILNRIPPKRTSIEKEIFPKMAAEQQLSAYTLQGYWMDIGQPKDFIDGMSKYLPAAGSAARAPEGYHTTGDDKKSTQVGNYTVIGSVAVHPSAQIGAGSVIGPNASVGANCKIGPCVRIANAAVFDNTSIGAGTFISRSIVGWNNRIGSWCQIVNVSVFGDDVDMNDGLHANGTLVCPNKGVSKTYKDPEVVL